MPGAALSPGYRPVLLGSVGSLEELGAFVPLEEGTDEGALILMRLDLAEYPLSQALSQLNELCLEQGMPPWPGNDYIVYADDGEPAVYLAWQKGLAWMPVIVGLLTTVILPPLLMSAIWWILPESVTGMIEAMVTLGMMVIPMFLMMKFMKSAAVPEKSEEIEEGEE